MKLRRLSAFSIGLALSTALSGTVLAADIEAPAVHDWTGFYIGGHAGYGWIDLEGKYTGLPDEDFIDDGGGDFDLDDDNVLAGFQAGYNFQIDNFVLGIEGDLSFVDWNDQLINDDNGGELVSFDTDYLMSLRARAGYAIDKILVFATAGAAWTNTNFYVNDHINNSAGNEKGNKRLSDVGFVLGGGGAYAIDENWSITAEALYYVFDQDEDTTDLTHNSEVGDFIKLDDIFVARVGVAFHF